MALMFERLDVCHKAVDFADAAPDVGRHPDTVSGLLASNHHPGSLRR